MTRVSNTLLALAVLAGAAAAAGCPATPPIMLSSLTSPMPAASAAVSGSPAPSATPSLPAMPTPGPWPSNLASPGAVRKAGVDTPPWPLPSDTLARIHAAGLSEQSTESFVNHVHSHLDVFVNGSPVTVPGLVGIDPNGKFISPLHTHQDDGILHIEAPQKTTFFLGQFLAEWGVSPDGFTVYVNGQKRDSVVNVVLDDHLEIVLVYGNAPNPIPDKYPATGP